MVLFESIDYRNMPKIKKDLFKIGFVVIVAAKNIILKINTEVLALEQM